MTWLLSAVQPDGDPWTLLGIFIAFGIAGIVQGRRTKKNARKRKRQ